MRREASGSRSASRLADAEFHDVPVFETERFPEVRRRNHLEDVLMVGAEGKDDRAGRPPKGGREALRAAVGPAPRLELLDGDAFQRPQELQRGAVPPLDAQVQGAGEGLEPQLLAELRSVALLPHVERPLAQPRRDRALDGQRLRDLEEAPVLGVLPTERLAPLGGELKALLAAADVARDQAGLEELEDAQGRRLLAHAEERAQVPGAQDSGAPEPPAKGDLLQGLQRGRLHGADNPAGVDNLFEALQDKVISRPQGDPGDSELTEAVEEGGVVGDDDPAGRLR